MKKRVAKSEIGFYIQKLISSGYKKVSSEISQKEYKVTLQREHSVVTISYTRNGWLNIS